MTILKAITSADKLIPNTIGNELKLLWLSELDGRLANKSKSYPYDNETETDTELYVSPPNDGIYINYLCMKIAMAIDDTAKYDMYLIQYNNDLQEYYKAKARQGSDYPKINYGW